LSKLSAQPRSILRSKLLVSISANACKLHIDGRPTRDRLNTVSRRCYTSRQWHTAKILTGTHRKLIPTFSQNRKNNRFVMQLGTERGHRVSFRKMLEMTSGNLLEQSTPNNLFSLALERI